MREKASSGSLVLFFWFICLAFSCVFEPSLTSAQETDFLDDSFYEDELEAESQYYDPIEPVNRAIFSFNDFAYTWVLDPVARGYASVLPFEIRECVANFFHNLEDPIRGINAVLQGRYTDAGTSWGRFLINSTAGVFGLGDPAATDFAMYRIHATMGQTLGHWGLGDGFYLVVPFLGPSTARDFSGSLVDRMAQYPYYTWVEETETTIGIAVGASVNDLSLHLGQYEKMKSLSVDPYAALRSGYFQNRARLDKAE